MGAFSDRRVAGTKKRRRRSSSSSLYPLLLLTALARPLPPSSSRHLSDDVVVWMGSVGRRRKEKEASSSRREKEQEDKGRGGEEPAGAKAADEFQLKSFKKVLITVARYSYDTRRKKLASSFIKKVLLIPRPNYSPADVGRERKGGEMRGKGRLSINFSPSLFPPLPCATVPSSASSFCLAA